MIKYRISSKRTTILFIIFAQTLLIASYFLLQETPDVATKNSVVFVKNAEINKYGNNTASYKRSERFQLDFATTKDCFTDFNSSLCYKNGTDIKTMERRKIFNWKCECLPFWHGNDCGQPESVWRALLTSRKKATIVQRKYERRLIYIFPVEEVTLSLAEIRLGELSEVVDLFVLFEIDENFLIRNLNKGFAKKYHKKILYLSVDSLKVAYSYVKNLIVNLKEDDLILYSNSFDIPNNSSLQFVKMYNNFPLLTTFRLRWSVFGFFWKHPQKTILNSYLSSVKILQELFNDNLELLSNSTNNRLVIGDLNHFGGWYCEYCNEPSEIITYLTDRRSKLMNSNVIDKTYLEDLIENGIYIDGKTELVRSHKYSESYFAPNYVNENNFKFDFLLVNMYSKLDYYEQ